MDGACGKRFLTLFCSVLVLGTAGCAELGGVPSWMPFQEEQSAELPGITSPVERIEELQELAERGPSSKPDEKQQVAAKLAQGIRTEADPLIRAEIVRTLGAYPSAAADAVLHAALGDPDVDVRMAAVEAWGSRGDAAAVAVLGGVLGGDVDIDVRLAAALALGNSKDPAAVAALAPALEDKDPAMQYRAVLSLRKITGENFGNDVNRWRQYVAGNPPPPRRPVSVAERLRGLFVF